MPELEVAYQRYLDVVAHINRTGAWGEYADLFSEDAVLRRVGAAEVHGREAIRAMMLTDTTTLPGSLIERTEVLWHTFDHDLGRVVQETRHVARDPGDGSVHFALATSMLRLGPDGLWDELQMVHSPSAYQAMFRGWARAASSCGHDEEARQVLLFLDDAHPVG